MLPFATISESLKTNTRLYIYKHTPVPTSMQKSLSNQMETKQTKKESRKKPTRLLQCVMFACRLRGYFLRSRPMKLITKHANTQVNWVMA